MPSHGLVEVRVEGANGETVDALYELVDEQGQLADQRGPDPAGRGRHRGVCLTAPPCDPSRPGEPRPAGERRRAPPASVPRRLAFLVQVDARMMTPLLPAIAHSLATSVTAMGLAMTLYMLPYGLSPVLLRPARRSDGRDPGRALGGDRLRRRRPSSPARLTTSSGSTRCASSRGLRWRR